MDVVYATANAVIATEGGGQRRVVQGSHWPADDPIVLAQPSLFSADARYGLSFTVEPEGYGAPVEQATAAPGEKRNRRA